MRIGRDRAGVVVAAVVVVARAEMAAAEVKARHRQNVWPRTKDLEPQVVIIAARPQEFTEYLALRA